MNELEPKYGVKFRCSCGNWLEIVPVDNTFVREDRICLVCGLLMRMELFKLVKLERKDEIS